MGIQSIRGEAREVHRRDGVFHLPGFDRREPLLLEDRDQGVEVVRFLGQGLEPDE